MAYDVPFAVIARGVITVGYSILGSGEAVKAMRLSGKTLLLGATDLGGHINCRCLTQLDLKVTRGTLSKPANYDPTLKVLVERGRRHEQAYLDHLASLGLQVTTIAGVGIDPAALAATLFAMKQGAPAIAQAAFQSGSVERPRRGYGLM